MTTAQFLNKREASERLIMYPEWRAEDDKLIANYVLRDFQAAMDFITLIAKAAKRLNHHPTWTNTYNRLQIELSTHDAGNRITALDIELARFISENSASYL